MNGWNIQPSPMKRKENDRNQTSMRTCSMLIFQGCMHPEAPYQYSISIYASDFLGAFPSRCTDPSELVRVYVWKAWPVEYSCVCFGRVAGTKNLSKNATNLPKKGDSSLNPSNLRVKCLVQSDLKPCKD